MLEKGDTKYWEVKEINALSDQEEFGYDKTHFNIAFGAY